MGPRLWGQMSPGLQHTPCPAPHLCIGPSAIIRCWKEQLSPWFHTPEGAPGLALSLRISPETPTPSLWVVPLLGGLEPALAAPAAPKLQLHPLPHGIYPPPASSFPLLHISLGVHPRLFSTESNFLFILLVLHYSSCIKIYLYCCIVIFLFYPITRYMLFLK